MAQLQIRLFGAPMVILASGAEASLPSDKARGLLAYLAVEAGQAHRREKLAGLLWPEQPEKAARDSLRNALATLRRAIGDETADPPFLFITREAVSYTHLTLPTSDLV